MAADVLPSISVIIPTLNSARCLRDCLESIGGQEYPENLLEIIVADGGSTDGTLKIVKEFQDSGLNIRTYANLFRTGEAGKAAGAGKARYDILAFIDSDNILPDAQWLNSMVAPFQDERIAAAEPLRYEYRQDDSLINRYCSLIGMNDPVCLFIGNYDRYCVLTGKWTGLSIRQKPRAGYLLIELTDGAMPTIGANGFLIRKSVLHELKIKEYLFDVDVLKMLVEKNGIVYVAKVDVGIIHRYCSDLSTFYRKQKRRIVDYHHYRRHARERGLDAAQRRGVVLFSLCCLTVIPLLVQALRGFVRRPDPCWFFHPIACLVTFAVYLRGTLANCLGLNGELSRNKWSQ